MNLTIDLAKTMMKNDNGNLDLHHMNITSLPEGLIVPGDLDIRYTRITSLPNGLKVGGNLYIDSAQTGEVPADINVCGEIVFKKKEVTNNGTI